MKTLITILLFISPVFADSMQSTDMDVMQAYQAGLLQGRAETSEKFGVRLLTSDKRYSQGYIDGYNKCDEVYNKAWEVKVKQLKYRYQYWDSVTKSRLLPFNQDFDHRKNGK